MPTEIPIEAIRAVLGAGLTRRPTPYLKPLQVEICSRIVMRIGRYAARHNSFPAQLINHRSGAMAVVDEGTELLPHPRDVGLMADDDEYADLTSVVVHPMLADCLLAAAELMMIDVHCDNLMQLTRGVE